MSRSSRRQNCRSSCHRRRRSDKNGRWAHEVPLLVLDRILSKLDPHTSAVFPLVCKSWHDASFPFYAQNSSLPLLLHVPSPVTSKCYFYDPWATNLTFAVDIPALSGATSIECAKDGWLLVTKAPDSLFVLNPFTGAAINLPNIRWWFEISSISTKMMSMSAHPGIGHWTVYGVSWRTPGQIEFWIRKEGQDEWSHAVHKTEFIPFKCFSLYHMIACVDVSGRYGFYFNDKWYRTDSRFKFPPHYTMVSMLGKSVYCVLLEDRWGQSHVRICKLDTRRFEWVTTGDLPEDVAVFLDRGEGLMASLPETRICFPMTEKGSRIVAVDARVVKESSMGRHIYCFTQTQPCYYAGEGTRAKPVYYSLDVNRFYPKKFGHCERYEDYATSLWIVPNFGN